MRQRVQTKRVSYPYAGYVPALSPDSAKQLNMHSAALVNNGATACALGIGVSVNATLYKQLSGVVSSFDNSGAFLSTTIGDALIIQSPKPFDAIAFSLTGTQADGVYAIKYYDGSSFVNAPVQQSQDFSAQYSTLVIAQPLDWAPGSTGYSGLDSSLYTLVLSVTTAPSGDIEGAVTPARLLTYREAVESKQALEASFEEHQLLLDANEAIIPVFSTASATNVVELAWRMNP